MLRSLFIALSANRTLRALAERSRLGRRLSSRFVAGLTIEDALAACRWVNAEGIAVSLDSLGESVTTESQARASAHIYHRLLDAIAAGRLNANVSLKLTQMGIDISPTLAETIVAEIVAHAAALGSFVRIDMESTAYTEATLALTERLHARYPGSVGTVLQAYLYRTEADAERLLGQGIRIRLCKGAYKESPEHAFPAKADVDANYIRLMQRLVTAANPAVFCGIATHDEAIINRLCRLASDETVVSTEAVQLHRTAERRDPHIPPVTPPTSPGQGIAKSAFEFQMLYGVRRDLQRRLAAQGFGVRVYIPFGTEWYPYFMRRLAERPANLLFLARNLLRS